MFPLLLHGGTAFQEAQLLWELQPQQSGSCSSLGDLGSVGCFWFFPLEAVLETNIKMFPQICYNNFQVFVCCRIGPFI